MKKLISSAILILSILTGTVKSNAVQNNIRISKSQIKSETTRTISASVDNVKGPTNYMFRECVGAGRANEGLRAEWQQQLRFTKNLCGFKYIRMHGLLNDDMGVYFEDNLGKPIYNWQYIDQLYDFLISIDVKPFVELSFMPGALASGNETFFWWNGNRTPPKDYKKWADLIKNLVLHFKERYGDEEVRTWYFEVWNEPNLQGMFFSGNMDEYFKLYKTTANAVKEVSKEYKVGGPATSDSKWVSEIIEYCSTNNVPIDFVSTHEYSTINASLIKLGITSSVLNKNKNWISDQIKGSANQVKVSAKPDLELHYTEWNSSWINGDPILDSYIQPAFILDQVRNTGSSANSMSFWVFTDIFEEGGPKATPFHGGFGLLNYQGIRKPAFYAYQFLNRLGETELVCSDPSSWVCKDKQGNIQILLWDLSISNIGDSISNTDFKRNMPAKNKGKVHMKIASVPDGVYLVETYKVGYRSNDAYTTYLDLGSPSQLTKKQVEAIKSVNSGNPESSDIIQIKDHKIFEQDLTLKENDVYFIELKKIK